MNRLIIGAGILLAILIGLDRTISFRREANRRLAGTIRPLPGASDRSIDLVNELQVTFRDTVWTYRLHEGTWRYPADHNAFVLPDPITRIIEDLIQAQGTVIVKTRSDTAYYGLDPSHRLKVRLSDSTASWNQTFEIGRSLPGRETREAFMKVVGNDTLFHAHIDPRPVFFSSRISGRPPLIDPKVWPTALERRAIERVAFLNSPSPVQHIQRIEIKTENEANPRLQAGPIYEWRAAIQNSTQKISNQAVYAYLGFIRRLQCDSLLDPSKYGAGNQRGLILTDDAGASDTLYVDFQNHHLKNQTTDQIMSVSKNRVDLLFPSSALLDSLPTPSPYDLAQPASSGSVVP